MSQKFVFAALLTTQTACTSAKIKSISDLPEERSKMVHAQAENWNILLQGTNNGFNEQVLEQLNKSCPNSKVNVSMVESRYTIYLLDFLYKEKVSAYGYCEKPS